jgi:hypothetical protein
MTETATAPAPDDTEAEAQDGEVEALAADETPLATSQAAWIAHVKTFTEDERQGIWGQTLN